MNEVTPAGPWVEKDFEPTMHLRMRRNLLSDDWTARVLQQKWERPNVFGGTDEYWADIELDESV